MIAYNKTGLDNIRIQSRMEKEQDLGNITPVELDHIRLNYPVPFYSPDLFIRAGLFVLTVVIIGATMGLFSLPFLDIEHSVAGLFIFFGLFSYAALEFIVRQKHFRSGVDDALLWVSPMLIMIGINLVGNVSNWLNALFVFCFSSFLALRFLDALMSVAAFIAFLACFFYAYIGLGDVARNTSPFLLLIICLIVALGSWSLIKKDACQQYKRSLWFIFISSLACLYISVNYYVVRESNRVLFFNEIAPGQSMPMGWLFWTLTFLIPVIYLGAGIWFRNGWMLRLGLILIPASVLSVRYYHALLPVETAMVMAGILLIGLSWFFIQWLKKPKRGFVSTAADSLHSKGAAIESLIIAQAMHALPATEASSTGTQFGGGSGAGGGAGGSF